MALSYDLIKPAVTAVQSHTYGLNDTAHSDRDLGGRHRLSTQFTFIEYSHLRTQGLKSQTKYVLFIMQLAMVCFQVFRVTTKAHIKPNDLQSNCFCD